LIHVSGTGNFVDGRKDGKYAGPGAGDSKVWNVSMPWKIDWNFILKVTSRMMMRRI